MKIFTKLFKRKPQPLKHSETPKKLKSKTAEQLRAKGTATIDGIEIKFWQKNNLNNIKDQLTWNKLKDFKELNSDSTGESGVVVLTGTFQIPRKEAADYATQLNFKVRSSVSKFTDYIVLGTENVSPSKVAKAIEYNQKGANIKFITEDTFLTILAEHL